MPKFNLLLKKKFAPLQIDLLHLASLFNWKNTTLYLGWSHQIIKTPCKVGAAATTAAWKFPQSFCPQSHSKFDGSNQYIMM